VGYDIGMQVQVSCDVREMQVTCSEEKQTSNTLDSSGFARAGATERKLNDLS
jgi:hypothetical protein